MFLYYSITFACQLHAYIGFIMLEWNTKIALGTANCYNSKVSFFDSQLMYVHSAAHTIICIFNCCCCCYSSSATVLVRVKVEVLVFHLISTGLFYFSINAVTSKKKRGLRDRCFSFCCYLMQCAYYNTGLNTYLLH